MHIQTVLATATLMAVAAPLWAADPVLVAAKVDGANPLGDPAAGYWNAAKPVEVAMEAQTTVAPTQPVVTVTKMNVRAVQNGKFLGLLLEWRDGSADNLLVTDGFGDQVAVEFPLAFNKDDLPNIMMGETGKPVSIWQWRAPLQYDKDKGKPTTKQLYPNSHYDIYPDKVLPAETAVLYTGAHGLGNPVSEGKKSAVMELVAEGFGTLTHVGDQQLVDGSGTHQSGVWRVAMTYPLGAESGVQLAPGGQTALGLAVWDGGNKDVGSRKAWAATWLPLQLTQ
ncbi:MAG: hypothetical protein HQL84_00435 [Magnetococcales bacterium]|nr:hypothetical protein [Magnetococcales bacterium]MBF0148495.1 hypothetical protein [Magnetococcales bacterium]MBF0173943.1 hypothetical protein [Magnetococcales bacterium]MBF0349062.1 hypothetical protein [Magnetococcales bacterium]MBF0632569.1 hypothetical protein [Magnetococcales bacterium]